MTLYNIVMTCKASAYFWFGILCCVAAYWLLRDTHRNL